MELLGAIGWTVFDRIRFGPLAISPHGIGIALGYLSGSWWMMREGPKRGVSEEHIGSILVWALIGAIVGARAFYVIGHYDEFAGPVEMLQIWKGGISLVGGVTGAVMAAYPLMRRFGYRFLQVMDSAALGLAFGMVIGRIGDLVIGDHLGKPTDFFLGFRYQGGDLPGYTCIGQGTSSVCTTTLADGSVQTLRYGDVVHQTALYDFIIALGLFAVLWWLNRKPRREGILIMTFAVVYGAGRVVTDFLRVDKTWFGLTGSQWTLIAVIVLSVVTLIRFALRPSAAPVSMDGEPVGSDGSTTTFVPPAMPGG